MPALGNALDFAKYEGRNLRAHQLGTAPAAPVTGQLYYNTADNTLYWWDNSTWVPARAGAASGAAGGDLTGTYPNPQIGAGVIVDADINGSAAIQKTKLAPLALVNADVAAGAAIAYSKLALTNSIVNADVNGAAAIAWSKIASALAITNADISASAAIALSKLAVDPLARANHTGTQLAATISNFDAQVRTSRLDQMAVPTAAVAFNGQRQTGVADGIAATDGATKGQLDAVVSGLDVKASCRAASTGNVNIAAPGAAIDGVTLANGERVLLKDQSTGSQNGIYVFNGAAAAMTRATDADTSAEVTAGLFTFVSEGTANADSGWYLTTNNPITLNTTALVFVQFSGAGQVIAGSGMVKTGNTLDVGVGNGLVASADWISLIAPVTVANGGTGQTTAKAARETGMGAAGYYSSSTHGAGTTITVTQATHGLRATVGLVVQVQESATGQVVLPDVAVNAGGDVFVTFGASVAANAYRVTIIG